MDSEGQDPERKDEPGFSGRAWDHHRGLNKLKREAGEGEEKIR